MKTQGRTRRSGRAVLSVLSAAAVLPLLASAIPASAEIGKEGFLIRAVNTADTSIQHTAGLIFDGTDGAPTGGGTFTPAKLLYNYNCGPLKLDITDKDVNFSKANESLLSQGKESEMKSSPSGGWKLFTSLTQDEGLKLGPPTSGAKPLIAALVTKQNGTANDTIAYGGDNGNACAILERRTPAVAGNTYEFSYNAIKDDPDGPAVLRNESRYVQEDGQLKPITITNREGSTPYTVIQRYSSSAEYPILDNRNPTGSRLIQIQYPEAKDGYDFLTIHAYGGSKMVNYIFGTSLGGGAGSYEETKTRTTGPVRVDLSSKGFVSGFTYINSSGQTAKYSPFDDKKYTVELKDLGPLYNSITGQNWDGKMPQIADFPKSEAMPFEVSNWSR